MRGQAPLPDKGGDSSSIAGERSFSTEEKEREDEHEREEEREQEAIDYSYDDEWEKREEAEGARFQKIKTGQSLRHMASRDYEASPFDLDRVNTRESFKGSKPASRASSPSRSIKSKRSTKSLKSNSQR